jgi:tRNA(adenine34) deaminase
MGYSPLENVHPDSRPSRDQMEQWMQRALHNARVATQQGDVPVGAVVVGSDKEVIAEGHNTREAEHDPTGHAEIVALRRAAQALGSPRLDGCTLVVTLEPCVMCAGAITQSGISRVVYGAADHKAGAAGGGPHDLVRDRSLPHRVDEVIGGVLADQSAALLRDFFEPLRD